ncbi:MAG TPA: amino acid permease C-terminal domain-containing protein, partial [Mycobacterium sp.]|nr:amino acid permease C-terminal domain-containing protein [Mycobacterium sp.]
LPSQSKVIVLRYRSPEIERGFRTPGMPVIPLIGVASSIWLTSTTWLRFAAWLMIRLVIYGSDSSDRCNT